MPRILRTAKAKEDTIEIWEYIGADNEAAADRVIDDIDQRLTSLSRFPLSGKAAPFIASGIYCSPVGRYVVYYRPIADGIEVLRVLHERQEQRIDST